MVQNLSRRETLLNRGVQNHIFGALESENYAAEQFSTLLGGLGNVMRGSYSTVVGGYQNEVSENLSYSTLLGGTSNVLLAGADNSTVVGGQQNSVSTSDSAAVVSGESNSVTSSSDSVTVGGLENVMSSAPGSVSLGGGLKVLGDPVEGNAMSFTRSSTMLGGYQNTIQGGYQAGIFSSWESEIDGLTGGTVQFSTICGGSVNKVKSANSGILGGHNNEIGVSGFGWNAIVGGGYNTMTNAQFSAMVGSGGFGTPSTMDYANRSVVAGGGNHSLAGISGASINNSAILGGDSNTVTHSRSVAIGGTGLSSDATDTVFMSKVHIENLPTSSAGLSAGTLWASGSSPNKYVRMA
jgi:hypothetical protein